MRKRAGLRAYRELHAMAHRLALYSVKVHPKWHPTDLQPLGDFDGGGQWLGTLIEAWLTDMAHEDGDGRVVLATRAMVATGNNRLVAASLETSEFGVASDIKMPNGKLAYPRRVVDSEVMKAFVMLQLPRADVLGLMAVHVPHGRGVKRYLEESLQTFFKARQPDHRLLINPVIPSGYLRAAAKANQIEKVRLVAYPNGSADSFESRDKWGQKEVLGAVELTINSKRLSLLRGKPIEDVLDNPKALNALLEFEGLKFDDMKVEILHDGQRRTITLSRQDVGFPLTVDIDEDIAMDQRGEPTDASLVAAVKEAFKAARS